MDAEVTASELEPEELVKFKNEVSKLFQISPPEADLSQSLNQSQLIHSISRKSTKTADYIHPDSLLQISITCEDFVQTKQRFQTETTISSLTLTLRLSEQFALPLCSGLAVHPEVWAKNLSKRDSVIQNVKAE